VERAGREDVDAVTTGREVGEAVWRAMPADFRAFWEEQQAQRSGSARQQIWDCEDGWLVGYTTERVRGGGVLEGTFAVLAYKPIGKGARGGRRTATEWKRVYVRGFAKRKTARARAEVLYYRHSPRIAARHGRGGAP